ncbi:hypothetical protein Q1695_011447 [Nippostrongylus brasiliensis]|nr:hypothetical protein Q1695_011447 [Nippostrongylus brasiliensis]
MQRRSAHIRDCFNILNLSVTSKMSRGYNNHPGRVPHPNSSYERWSYNGYQQPPPDFYNHNNFAGPVPPYGRGAPSRYQLDRK